ncbi:MAG: radical SAM protein [Ignavibacteria bacterium]|nr:radical SAM protein [Ignavibacteria bacterium]
MERKRRVLLVGSPKTILGFSHLARVPNLGLCSMAAYLDQSIFDVRVVDLVLKGTKATPYFQRLLHSFRPEVVGISCMVFQYADAVALARLVKSWNPSTATLVGGYHPTVAFDEIVESDDMHYIDFVVRGEGEGSLANFLGVWKDGAGFSEVPGISYRSEGSVVHNPPGDLVDLHQVPLPRREARILRKGFHTFGMPADAIETSRGCTYDCNFCSISQMYGRTYRIYKIERVLNDIRDAKCKGARALMITDDNITLDGSRYRDICEAIVDAKLDSISYSVQASVRGIKSTPGLVKAMAESGVKWVFLGIEGASDQMLASMRKDVQYSNTDAADVVRELKERGIMVIGGFILGYPDDDEQTFRLTLDYALNIKVDLPLFQILTPYPKTPIREELLKQGLITNEHDYSKYTCYHANVRTKYLSAEALRDLRDEIEQSYRYTSGMTWRVAKKYPLFFAKLVPRWLAQKPAELLNMIRHLSKRD